MKLYLFEVFTLPRTQYGSVPEVLQDIQGAESIVSLQSFSLYFSHDTYF
jgi:hypothetical protein